MTFTCIVCRWNEQLCRYAASCTKLPPIIDLYLRRRAYGAVAVTLWRGDFTEPGDVTKHLKGAYDLFVVCGPGGEIRVDFDARQLPPTPAGYSRSLRCGMRGYCKDASPFTLTGGYVEPLPKRRMKTYPP